MTSQKAQDSITEEKLIKQDPNESMKSNVDEPSKSNLNNSQSSKLSATKQRLSNAKDRMKAQPIELVFKISKII